MNRLGKTSLVLGGYGVALLLAIGITFLWVTLRLNFNIPNSQGMSAFGDGMFFLGVLALGLIPPTALGLWFLRKNNVFWNWASIALLVFSATAPLAEGLRAFIKTANLYNNGDWMWVDVVSLIRTLGIPLLAIGYAVCFLIAPTARIRWTLGLAIALEAVTGLYILFLIEFSHRFF